MIVALLEAMRPWQWTKNLLLVAPLVFAQRWLDRDALLRTGAGFALFCLLASGLYLMNDIVDRESDRRHEKKQSRPIAAGRLPVPTAAFVAALLIIGSLLSAWFVPQRGAGLPFFYWAAIYGAQTTLYSYWLKRRVIIDCLCIAFGFVLRVLAGGAAAGVECSSWILLCTFFFALFLAFCKRREEVLRHGENRGATRTSLRDYDLPFLDQMIAPLAALSILSYALYTVAPETLKRHNDSPNLLISVPFVVFGVFRYLFLVHRRGLGMDPARLLFRDKQLLASGVLWSASVYVALGAAKLW